MQDNHIKDDRVRGFVAALRRFEQGGDPSVLTDHLTDDATLMRLDGRGERGDAEAFWQEYRGQFQKLSTTFYNAVEGGDKAALEWHSEGTLTDGRPIDYRGVTVLGFRDDKVARVATYYDTAAFLQVTAGKA